MHLIQSNNGQPAERADSTLPLDLCASSASTSFLVPHQMVMQCRKSQFPLRISWITDNLFFFFWWEQWSKLKGLGKAEVMS